MHPTHHQLQYCVVCDLIKVIHRWFVYKVKGGRDIIIGYYIKLRYENNLMNYKNYIKFYISYFRHHVSNESNAYIQRCTCILYMQVKIIYTFH